MKVLQLKDDNQLQIFMHPKRQDILHLLSVEGPATAKMVSDALAMTPSSAKHHLLKLQGLGVVEEDHTRLIHGIKATYYRKAEVAVSFGELDQQKQRLVSDFVSHRIQNDLYAKPRTHQDEDGHFAADQLSGLVHLSREQADQVYQLIRSFVEEHEQKIQGTEAYVYSLVAYRV
jgi:DNA-binding transcriptional ArsR family regulator